MQLLRHVGGPTVTAERESGIDRIDFVRGIETQHNAAPSLLVGNPSAGFFGIIGGPNGATDAPCAFDIFADIASTTVARAPHTRNGVRR
jgi:hypothetical protein